MARKYLERLSALTARLIAMLVFRGPVKLHAGRREVWLDPATGRLIPAVAGGDDGDGDGSGDGNGDGDGQGDGDGAGDGDGDGDGDGEGDGDGDGGDGSGSGSGAEPDWKAMSRKHERRAKNAEKLAKQLRGDLGELKKGQQTEQEKALEEAKKQARQEALAEAAKERRADRLEVAVTRHATKGVTVMAEEDGKTVEKTVKFADPDDALVHLERAIARGDVDEDDIFDDQGKVQADGLRTALAELLEDRPHLVAKAESEGRKPKPKGEADAGRGSGSGKDLEDMSPDDHLKALQKR